MHVREFFLEQHACVRSIIDEMVLGNLSDDQIRYPSQAGLNSLVWLLWHTARWQDFSMRVVEGQDRQLLDQDWLARMNVYRRDVGTSESGSDHAPLESWPWYGR
jgi:hypothetical protein